MQANAIIYTGQIVSTLIGNDLLTKAISDTANTIYNLLYGLVDLQDPVLDKAIDELDVKAQIKCVESIIANLDNDNVTRSLNISLEQLHEIICRIREDLKQINHNFIKHQQKYFFYYRRIANLKRHKAILDQRMEMFMKIFTIDNINTSPNKLDTMLNKHSHEISQVEDITTKNINNNIPKYGWKHKVE